MEGERVKNKGWALDGERERRDAAEEWMKRGVYIYRGPCGPGWSMGAGAIFFSSTFISPSPPLFKIALLGGLRGWAPPLLSSPLSLFTLSFPPQSAPLTGGAGAVMDDALSESDNIFSQSPKRDRAASEAGRSWPLSVFVRSICCVQSPLSRPPYRLHWACANWS